MADEIRDGDTVRVKSGGPLMTVAWVENGQAYCEWFDGKKACREKFFLTVLEKHEKGTTGFQQNVNW